MSELKPCPWCGDAAELKQYGHRYWVVCTGCRSYRSGTDEHAIEAWNQRHDPIRTKLRALVARIRERGEVFDVHARAAVAGNLYWAADELEALIGGEDE